MDSPIEPLQRLPQQPLISPTGARLVLCSRDAGYPQGSDPSSPGRGEWLDIASTDAKAFLHGEDGTQEGHWAPPFQWKWSAVVLMPEECKLRVGGMSVTELQSQLEKYWGRGDVLGAAAHAWAPDNTGDPYNFLWNQDYNRLDSTTFSRWVNRECSQWLDYFISTNHTFGAVYAWFSAFLGVMKGSLPEITKLLGESYDEVIDGLPSLPLDTEITTSRQGIQAINNSLFKMLPRRVWDICANTVIPITWFHDPIGRLLDPIWVRPVSHAWVSDEDLTFIMTEANQQLWPIPLPSGVLLEDVRGEMIRLGVRYAWLDVLCLRQQAQPALARDLTILASREVIERREQRRLEEWKVDVPTIGAVYSNLDESSLYGTGPTVTFMSGLGRPFRDNGLVSKRRWLRGAWTLQETPVWSRYLLAGLPGGTDYQWGGDMSLWPWSCKVDDDDLLHAAVNSAASVRIRGQLPFFGEEILDLNDLLLAIRGRHSSNPIDKVCAIAFPFMKHHSTTQMILPVYHPSTPASVAWGQLISSIASTKESGLPRSLKGMENRLGEVSHTPTIKLLCLFPHASRHHWFPSWTQVQQYPDVSVRDNDPCLLTGDTDYSLRITYGRIYRGCSLQLIDPPTPNKKAIYCCTMDGKDAQLVATVPGIELNIDSRSKYVLVDISPDRSLWSNAESCRNRGMGHEHLPVWQESVVIVCKEVDTLSQTAAGVTASSSAIMKYHLNRVTTLKWDCRLSAKPGPGRWLPFNPSLVHIRSILCSANGGYLQRSGYYYPEEDPDANMFCDPAAVADLLHMELHKQPQEWYKPWPKRWSMHEVYLI